MPVTRIGEMNVHIAITQTPDGRPAVLLQLPDGFVLMTRHQDAHATGEALIEAAAALKDLQHTDQT